MKQETTQKLVAYLALISGLSISAVAVYYSVVGLTAIFAAAVIPIIVMGTTLEISKLIATVWLKQNWDTAPATIKAYLIGAIIVLMLITSMGIFGFLSKAHLDQGVPTDDIAAKVSVIDEKIKTQKDNIDTDKKALAQMDAQVDQLLSRTTDDRGASKAAQLRKTQAKERAGLQADIATAQKTVTALNDERAPVASQLRKVEAEVGPIKYIAAFFYGSTDQTILEKAVTWVILTLIVVFDPLAVILLLASQISFQNIRKKREYDEHNWSQTATPDEALDDAEEKAFFARGKEIARQADKVSQVNDSTPPAETKEVDPLELWNKILAAAEKQSSVPQPVTLPPQPHVWKTTVYPPAAPTVPSTESYVQNEEQSESGLWNQISEKEYRETAVERTIDEIVTSVREGRLPLYKVPDEIRAQVKERLDNDR